MIYPHNNSVLEAFDLLDQLVESPSGQFNAVHAGSKFVPAAVRNKLHDEAFSEYSKGLSDFKHALEVFNGHEEEKIDDNTTRVRFNDEKSTLSVVSKDTFTCRVCYSGEEELRYQDWAYKSSHYGAGLYIRLTIDGVNYHDYRGTENKYYRGLYDIMSDIPGAKAVVDKACREAEAKLLEIAKKYLPNAEIKPTRIFMNTDFGTMAELDFSKDYQIASEKFNQLLADYEVSDDEIEAEENRINKAIMDYYASKKPGEYVGD